MATDLDAQQRIFDANPEDRRAFEALEEHFFLEADWQALTELYRRRIEAPSVEAEASLQAPLLFRLGQILEERILDLEAANEVYWQLARLDPSNRPALRQLRGIHERSEQWELVLQIAELESQTTMPPYERAVFEAQLGRTWQHQIGDSEEARRAYERALESDPDCPAALEGLAELHRDAGRPAEAAEVLERLTARLRGPERAPAWVALGTLYSGPLEDPVRATHCFESALEDDPFQTPAVEWALLLATASEDWPSVAELLERRFDLAAGARHRAAIAVEASQLQLNYLESPAGARAWVDRATDLAHDDLAVLLAQADVERVDGDPYALLDTLDQILSVGGKHAPRAALLEAARLHLNFGQHEPALAALVRASEKPGPDDGEVLTLQAHLLRETGAKRELADVLETICSLDPGEEIGLRAAQQRELARLYEEDLGDAASAQGAWQRAFDLEPSHPDAQIALERIHRKANDWDGLRTMLETALDTTEGAGRAPLSAGLGGLLLDTFDDPDGARRHFEAALEEASTCREALAGLRRIAEEKNDADLLLDVCTREAEGSSDGDEMAGLVHTVVPILEARGEIEAALDWVLRWNRLSPQEAAEPLELRARLEERLDQPEAEIESRRALARLQVGADQNATLRRLARLHEGLDDDEAAAIALEQARDALPDDLETSTSLIELYRRLERPRELVQVLRQQVELLPESEQAESLDELARILQGPLGDLETAIVIRWRLVDLPGAPDDAHEKLEALLDATGRYAELVQLLDSRRQHLGNQSREAFELDVRRARLRLDALGHPEEAAEILSALHERHPDDDTLLEDLERALRVAEDARGLCDLLEQRAGWEDDEDRRLAMQFERASLLEESLGEPVSACDLYEEIARETENPSHASHANERLERLLEASGEWARLRELLTTRLESIPEHEHPALRERIALISRDRLGDIASCAGQYEAIARIAPDRIHVWQELEAIYAHELDRPDDWLRVVEAELASDPTPDREFSLRVGAARLCLDDERRPREHEISDAYAHYERVLELDPHHAEAAEVLAVHHTAEDRPAEAARVLETRLDSLTETCGPETHDLQLRLARIYYEALEDSDRARALFEAARTQSRTPDTIAEPLAEIYADSADHAALAELCRDVFDARKDETLPTHWRVRLGASERALGHLDEAAVAYRTALVDSPDDREIEDALIEIYREVDESDPLVELLEKRLPYAHAEESISLRLELARVHAEGRQAPREALTQLEQILDIHPQHRDAFDRALALAEDIGDSEKTLELIERGLATTLPNTERAALLERRGRMIAETLANSERALPSFREAIALDPSRKTAADALRGLLERLERWPAVLDCLFVEACEADATRRIELFEDAVEVAWEHLNPDAALPWLTRLRTEKPDDPRPLARVAEAHRRAGRFEAALRAMDDELALRPGESDRCALHLERARLLERDLLAPGRAILAYQQALELASDREEILAELDRLYDSMGRPFERAEILEARVSSLEGEAGVEMRQTLATLYCVELSKPELAVPHLLRNVDATRAEPGQEIGHLGALDAALRASARFDAWVRVAERELELIETRPEIGDSTPDDYVRFLREELARIYDEEIGNPDRAIEQLRILSAAESASAERSRTSLRNLLRRTGRRAALAENLTAYLCDSKGQPSGSGQPSDWLELGLLREETLLDWAGAALAYEQARHEPACAREAIRGLRRCSERRRDWAALAEALDAELAADVRLDRRERAATAHRLGDVYWQRLAAGERAAEAYERALELDPTRIEVLRELTHVREACSDASKAIALYRRELDLLGEEPEEKTRRREVWLRIASLSRDTDGSRSDAIAAYRAAAALEPLAASDELCLARLCSSEGDLESFCNHFSSWCDRDDSGATVDDHLELARCLHERGDAALARTRTERATELAPESAAAWLLVAELELEAGHPDNAADAFDRAAQQAEPEAGARHRVAAAAAIESTDLERAHTLLVRAVAQDSAYLSARVELVRVSDRLGLSEETARDAETTLTLGESMEITPETRLEIALLGGRAARILGQRAAARRLFGAALEIEPNQVEGLEGVAEADFEDGDYRAARALLELRIDQPGENPKRASQLAMIARGLEAESLLDAAWARYEEAIELDSALEVAHEGLVRVHERAARTDEALGALEHWIECSCDADRRAQAALRAAEAALAIDDKSRALGHLEIATQSDPQLTPAWLLRCELVAGRRVDSETREVCTAALDTVAPDSLSSAISLRLARLEEAAGDREAARERYAEAARWDPRCVEAVLCESRLARLAGDWVAADGVLARFVDAHPDPNSPTLAHVFLERGRLLSGPLEDFDDAITAYEQALALQPDLHVARTALAGLLLHAPDRWQEALALHRSILETAPTTSSSLRAVVSLAESRGQTEIASGALAVLRAIGQASPQEASDAPNTIRFAIHPGPPMKDAEAERMRRLAHLLREELEPILANVDDRLPSCPEPAVEEAIRQIAELESELTAPRLARLASSDRARLFDTIAMLFLDPGGNGGDPHYREALERGLGLWTRRKARRIVEDANLAAIQELDHEAWGDELRAIAAAQVIDRNGGDLRSVLRALLVFEAPNPEEADFEGAAIGTLASTSESARRLLTRITTLLCERLENGR